jgi:hypothetical protein
MKTRVLARSRISRRATSQVVCSEFTAASPRS